MINKQKLSSSLVLYISSFGHLLNHFFETAFYMVAIILAKQFDTTYSEVITYALLGKILFGVLAPISGWLSDKFGYTNMMIVYFLGTGAASILLGLANTKLELLIFFTFLGALGSIYHPTGIPWIIKSVKNQGTALGINGVFGSLGPAISGLITGIFIDQLGWRAAFFIPATFSIIMGLLLLLLKYKKIILNCNNEDDNDVIKSSKNTVNKLLLLCTIMIFASIIFNAIQAVIPSLVNNYTLNDNMVEVGGIISLIYLASGLIQLLSGKMSDKYNAESIYLLCLIVQTAVLLCFIIATDPNAILILAALISISNASYIPVENVLIARYSPKKWLGTMFGIKFIINYGVGSLGLTIVSSLYSASKGHDILAASLFSLSFLSTMVFIFMMQKHK